jgi:signal transduction histidine kinase
MKYVLPRTLQARLILSHLVVSLISVALISLYAGQTLFNAVRAQVEHRYEDLLFAAVNQIEQPLQNYLAGQHGSESIQQSLEPSMAYHPEVQYVLYLADGTPLLSRSGELPPPATQQTTPELWAALNSPIGEGEQFRPNSQGQETLYLAARIQRDRQILGVLRLEIPIETWLAPARSALAVLIASALLVALGMGLFGYFLARNVAGPIEKITQTAESLARGDMSARVVAPATPHEVHRLAEAFNHMATRLETYVNEMRTFVANASHELRTPLTSIKLRVEALRNGALDDPPVTERFLAEVESEVDRLSHMVNDLLDLSRIEAGLEPSQRAMVDLAAVVNDVYEAFKVRAERSGIHLTCSTEPGLPPVLGVEDQLRRMLYNLVDNAIKYTPRGGKVEISLTPGSRAATIRLMVKDSGFGIAPSHLPHVFERFYRVEATRPRFGPPTGSGLGLPIAKSIAETHGGEIGVTSQLGKGSTFWVELPTAR